MPVGRTCTFSLLAVACIVVLPLALYSNEVDQFSRRDLYETSLPDSLSRLNTLTNKLLDSAVDDWNKRFASSNGQPQNMDTRKAYHYLALYIHNAISREDRNNLPSEEEAVPDQVDIFRAIYKSGHGPLQTTLEDVQLQGPYLIYLLDDVYRDVYPSGFNSSWIIKVAGILVGTDKIDHFFDQGYEYWCISKDGSDDAKAIKYGVDSEWGWFGMIPAGVFSFADLRANWMGYHFYLSLAKFFRVNAAGKMEHYASFKWQNWIDWQFDELLNPSAYSASMYRNLSDWMSRWEDDFKAGKTDYSYTLTRERLRAKGYFDHKKWHRSSEYYNDNIPHEYLDLFEHVPNLR